MDVEKVLKLINAGFTADEIRNLLAKTPVPVDGALQPEAPEPAQAPEPAPAPAPDPVPADPAADPVVAALQGQIQALGESIKQLSNNIVNPTLNDVKPLGIDDIITRFFKED